MDNSEINFLMAKQNIFCDPSSEPSLRDGSNEGHNIFFYGDIRELPTFFLLPPFLSEACDNSNFQRYYFRIKIICCDPVIRNTSLG